MHPPLDAESSNRSLPGDSFSQGPGARSPLGTQDDDVVELDPSGRYSRYATLVGAGRFKRVFRAFDERRGVDVAWAKIDPAALGLSPPQAELAAEEMEKGVCLNHPSVIRVFECWRDPESGVINMITEFFTSGNLRDYRKRHKSLSPAAVRKWARQILAGLAYLHGLDPPVAHGDLRADKVYVNGHSGEIKIGDLGLASLSPRRFEPGVLPGDAPSEHYTPAVDVFALGLVIIEVTTGKPMGRGDRQSWHDALAGVTDPEARRFAERCLAPPDERPTVFQLLDDPFVKVQRKATAGRAPTAACAAAPTPTPTQTPEGLPQASALATASQQQLQQLQGACSPTAADGTPLCAPGSPSSAPPRPGSGASAPGPLPGAAGAGAGAGAGASPPEGPWGATPAPALHAAVEQLSRVGLAAGAPGSGPWSGADPLLGSAPLSSAATSAAATPGYCSPSATLGEAAARPTAPAPSAGAASTSAAAADALTRVSHLPPGSPRRAHSPAEGAGAGAGSFAPEGVSPRASASASVPSGLLSPPVPGSADLVSDLGPSSTVCEAGSVQGEDYLFQFSGKIRDGKLHFRLHMIFDGSVTDDRAGTSKTIEFAYDPDADTPDSIAAEISEEFHLSSTDVDICAAALREWLAKEMETHEL